MREVVSGLFWVSLHSMVNVYLAEIPDGLMLVDTGYGWQAGQIMRAVNALAEEKGPLRHVVITHGHSDHVGGAAEIHERTGAGIWMHPADARALTAGEGNRAVSPAGGGLVFLMMSGGVQAAEVAGELADHMVLPFAPAWEVVYTPGHTPGGCCLYHQAAGVLIIGDLLMHWLGRLSMPFAMVTVDRRQNAHHVRRVAELDFHTVLFGHGPPLRRNAKAQVRRLVGDQQGQGNG